MRCRENKKGNQIACFFLESPKTELYARVQETKYPLTFTSAKKSDMRRTCWLASSLNSHYQGCFSIVFTGHSLK